MAYQAEISRSNPSCFLFLLDQSGYMAYPFAGSGGRSKADELPTIINRLLASLVIRCSKDEGVRGNFSFTPERGRSHPLPSARGPYWPFEPSEGM